MLDGSLVEKCCSSKIVAFPEMMLQGAGKNASTELERKSTSPWDQQVQFEEIKMLMVTQHKETNTVIDQYLKQNNIEMQAILVPALAAKMQDQINEALQATSATILKDQKEMFQELQETLASQPRRVAGSGKNIPGANIPGIPGRGRKAMKGPAADHENDDEEASSDDGKPSTGSPSGSTKKSGSPMADARGDAEEEAELLEDHDGVSKAPKPTPSTSGPGDEEENGEQIVTSDAKKKRRTQRLGLWQKGWKN